MAKISVGVVIALAATGIFLTLITAGAIVTQTKPSNATISAVNIEVYSDSGCTQSLTSLDWGTLYPGNTTTRTIYVKNTGMLPVRLAIADESWAPTTASSVLALTWNRQNTVLNVDQTMNATLTLRAAASTGSLEKFSFNIIVTGEE